MSESDAEVRAACEASLSREQISAVVKSFRRHCASSSDIPDRDGVQVATDRHARGTSPSPSARCQPPRLGSYGPAGAMKLAVDVAGLA